MSAPRSKAPSTNQEVARQRALDSIVPEVMGAASKFDETSLRDLATFDAALAMAEEAHGEVHSASEELGDGFALLKNPALLVGLPLILLEWAFRPGDFGTYVSVRVVAKLPGGSLGKFVINDGGTGIAEQLAGYTKAHNGKTGGLVVENGLSKSDYFRNDETGEIQQQRDDSKGFSTPATTWYLDTGARA